MGDIIYSLPAVEAMGGGKLCLDTDGGASSELIKKIMAPLGETRLKFNLTCYNFLFPLLSMQPYLPMIKVLEGEPCDYDLDKSRNVGGNSAIAHAMSLGISVDLNKPWVSLPPSETTKYDFIISRSLRYHSNQTWWELQKNFFKEQNCAFVGTDLEHQVFEEVFSYGLKHEKVDDALQLACIISGAKSFAGNQGLPMAIAAALHKPYVQEVYSKSPVSIFPWGQHV